MVCFSQLFLLLPIWLFSVNINFATDDIIRYSTDSTIPNEAWGYIDVRDGAHMFWWFYGCSNPTMPREDIPLVLWLQGGPGAGGTGYGNFGEIGPIDEWFNIREYSWVNRVNLLFIDNPVGAGYSYVDNTSLLTSNIEEISDDLLTMHEMLYDRYSFFETMFNNSYWIFSESYGGKMAAHFGQTLLKSDISNNFKFNGVLLGDSWIQGVSYVNKWADYLNALTLLDDKQYNALVDTANECQNAVDNNEWYNATIIWAEMEYEIETYTNDVDFYNILLFDFNDTDYENTTDSVTLTNYIDLNIEEKKINQLKYHHLDKIGFYLNNRENRVQKQQQQQQQLTQFTNNNNNGNNGNTNKEGFNEYQIWKIMNSIIKEELSIIPDNVEWGGQSDDVFMAQITDFMKPVIDSVDYLLSNDISVNIWNGQLDLICCTLGTLNWMKELEWDKYDSFLDETKVPLYSNVESDIAYFKQSYDNLAFYYIMKAGHMVPADNGYAAIQALCDITGVSCDIAHNQHQNDYLKNSNYYKLLTLNQNDNDNNNNNNNIGIIAFVIIILVICMILMVRRYVFVSHKQANGFENKHGYMYNTFTYETIGNDQMI